MFGIALKWLLGGSVLAQAALAAGALLLGASVGTIGGYVKGQWDCADAAQVASLKAQVSDLQRQLSIRDWLDETGRDQANEAADAEDHNLKVDEVVKDVIDTSPSVPNCAPSAFFDRLRNYR